MAPNLSFERELFNKGYLYVAGVDECGRGCIAGPVLACAVVLYLPDHLNNPIEGVDDSKKLTSKAREKLFPIIAKRAIDFRFGCVKRSEIDRYNILNASLRTMSKAVMNLKHKPDIVVADGRFKPKCEYKTKNLIKADSISYTVATASILCKVMRDRIMVSLAKRYPFYGWERNMGYSTSYHKIALLSYGVSPQHRASFKPIREIKHLISENSNREEFIFDPQSITTHSADQLS
ncbi:MAG: ribonuclease HII [Candidatus Coatesbacteria bacterium]|nr:MAG: ribonuclease HII [Candidatus Coatesbacteria bacterium]RLC44789.1 MAG: ribonuclease HII [Candidatus Coatesbacteria bacterium]HEC79743.1 ribonuclease HII [Bacillota bacterium]